MEAGEDTYSSRGATLGARQHPTPPGASVPFPTGPGVATFTLLALFLAFGGPSSNSGRGAIIADECGLSADLGEEAFRQDGNHTSKAPGSA